MMAAVMLAGSDVPVEADAPAAVRERLEDFGAEVLEEAMNRPAQAVNGGLIRGREQMCLCEAERLSDRERLVDEAAGGSDQLHMRSEPEQRPQSQQRLDRGDPAATDRDAPPSRSRDPAPASAALSSGSPPAVMPRTGGAVDRSPLRGCAYLPKRIACDHRSARDQFRDPRGAKRWHQQHENHHNRGAKEVVEQLGDGRELGRHVLRECNYSEAEHGTASGLNKIGFR
jgi:hypothetical protein